MTPSLSSVVRCRGRSRALSLALLVTVGMFTLHAIRASQALAHGCIPFQASCYHEVAGHRYGSLKACKRAGVSYMPNITAIGWYKCVPEQPSGWLWLYIWSFRCPKGMTFQWCAAHHKL